MRTLSDGSQAECYVITVNTIPTEHEIGPWAPRHVTDGKDKGGIWIKDGHVNPHVGYHYHAATGKTKEIEQADDHAPQIGYALDGFAIFGQLDKNGNAPTELDECSGHYDEIRGYHYHASAPAENQIIGAFRGIPDTMEILHRE